MTIQPFCSDHWPQVRAIYAQSIATGHALFQTEAPSLPEWHSRYLPHSRLVARHQEGAVLGWAALTPVAGCGLVAGTAEVSVHVNQAARGLGVGRQLLDALLVESERHGIWTLQTTLLDDDHTTLSIYAGAGFRIVGYREGIVQLQGMWRNTILLERRSVVVNPLHARPAAFYPAHTLTSPYVNL